MKKKTKTPLLDKIAKGIPVTPMLTITTGTQAKPGDQLNKCMRLLADFRERGCYPGEDVELAETIVVLLIKRYGVKPFEVNLKLREKTS